MSTKNKIWSVFLACFTKGEVLLRNEDIISLIEEEGDEIALIMFPGILFVVTT